MLYAFVLAALVKLLIETENPLLCAGIFAILALATETMSMLYGYSAWYEALLSLFVVCALAYGYFWLLNRIETASLPWWSVLLGGALVAFFL